MNKASSEGQFTESHFDRDSKDDLEEDLRKIEEQTKKHGNKRF
jgi:hypothetical protein